MRDMTHLINRVKCYRCEAPPPEDGWPLAFLVVDGKKTRRYVNMCHKCYEEQKKEGNE